jgi:hypothetical protein
VAATPRCSSPRGEVPGLLRVNAYPSVLQHIHSIVELYDKRFRAELLIVGHTDTTGGPDVNDPLSLNRARSIKAYLTDDVETWLDFYGDHMHANARWGAHEDHLMLDAVLAATGEEVTDTRVRHFQATRGLEPDNKLGENTRRALITEYMAADGTTLPRGIEPVVHGCGANFPLAPDDPPDHTHDRRVELFFFDADLGVLPPPPGDISSPDTPEYPEWRRRAAETHDFRVQHLVTATRFSFDGFFHENSAVFLPWRPTLTTDASRPLNSSLGFVGLLSVLELLEDTPDVCLTLAGHASATEGAAAHSLSEARARCVRDLLMGDPEAISRAFEAHGRAEDDHALLRAFGRNLGWPCDPGSTDSPADFRTRAVRAFQEHFNLDFDGSLVENGIVDPPTRVAFAHAWYKIMESYLGVRKLSSLHLHLRLGENHGIIACGSEYPPRARRPNDPPAATSVEAIVLHPIARQLAEAEDLYDSDLLTFVDEPLYPRAFDASDPPESKSSSTAKERPRTTDTDMESFSASPENPWGFLEDIPVGWNQLERGSDADPT